jgi:acetoin utilization protein AcuB
MKARDVMTPSPITLTPEATLAEVWDLMRQADIRHVPVVEAGVLVGMVSDRDLASLDVARVLTADGAEALRRALATPVVTVMSADVIFVEMEDDLDDVIELMLEHRVGAIPVVRPDTRDVMGIVSYIDVLRGIRDLVAED